MIVAEQENATSATTADDAAFQAEIAELRVRLESLRDRLAAAPALTRRTVDELPGGSELRRLMSNLLETSRSAAVAERLAIYQTPEFRAALTEAMHQAKREALAGRLPAPAS